MNEKLNFMSPLYDTTFKALWNYEIPRKWLTRMIYYITDINLDEYNQSNQELNTGNNLKDYRMDIYFTNKEDPSIGVNIEMYKDYSESSIYKSHAYIFRILNFEHSKTKKYSLKRVVQVNFNNALFKYNPEVDILCYQLRDKSGKYEFDDIKKYDVFLPNYKGICYNEADELSAMLSLINADSFDEMRRIAAGNEEALSIVETLEEIMLDEKVSLAYNVEKEKRKLELTGFEKGYDEGKAEGRTEGLEEGKKEANLEIAKKMINEGLNSEIISNLTNFSIEEIENLK